MLSAGALVDLLVKELLPSAEPAFGGVGVLDYHVEKYPQSVSWFSPGSYRRRPTIRTSVSNLGRSRGHGGEARRPPRPRPSRTTLTPRDRARRTPAVCCGDWVNMEEREFGAKGLYVASSPPPPLGLRRARRPDR